MMDLIHVALMSARRNLMTRLRRAAQATDLALIPQFIAGRHEHDMRIFVREAQRALKRLSTLRATRRCAATGASPRR
jgi:hypothetical protein